MTNVTHKWNLVTIDPISAATVPWQQSYEYLQTSLSHAPFIN